MKNKIALIVFVLCSVYAFAQPDIKIGMSLNSVKQLHPEFNSTVSQNAVTLTKPDTLYGLNGEWGYRFENEKLTWIYFNKYIDEINEANFKKCLSAAEKLIEDYSKPYNKPDTLIIGDTLFVDPYIKKHWGYDVVEAKWKKSDNMKIKIEFTFMGGKGEYSFLVKINYFDTLYPYFD